MLLGAVLVGVGVACFIGQHVRERGWIKATPTVAYIAFLPRLDTDTTIRELSDRVNEGKLRQWEYRLLVHRCVGLLERQEGTPERMADLAWMLARIEIGGRNLKEEYPWASWALVSEIDHQGAINALVGLLEHEDPAVRLAAVRSLGQFTEQAVSAMPALLGRAADDDTKVRAQAFSSLGFLTHRQRHALSFPWYGRRLAKLEDAVFFDFCSSMGRCKTDSDCALPMLSDGLNSESPIVRAVSVYGLVLLGGSQLDNLHRIVELQDDEEEMVRRTVVRAMASFPWTDRSAEVLDRALSDPSRNICWAALRTIATIGPEASVFVDPVRTILEDNEASSESEKIVGSQESPGGFRWFGRSGLIFNPSLITEAAKTFVRIGGDPEVAIDALIEALEKCTRSSDVADVLGALARLRVESPSVRAAVEPLLKDDDPNVRSAAAYAFGISGGNADVATRAVIEALRAEQQATGTPRFTFSRVLWLADADGMSMSVLIEMLHSEQATERAFAARLIGRAGKRAAPALPRLKGMLADPDPNVVRWADDAVRRIEYDLSSGGPSEVHSLK